MGLRSWAWAEDDPLVPDTLDADILYDVGVGWAVVPGTTGSMHNLALAVM